MLRRIASRPLVLTAAGLLLAAAACGGQGQTAGRTTSPTHAATPAAAVPTPTMLVSPIPLPSTAQLDARANSVVWALVGGLELFRSTDAGRTWEQRPLPAGIQSPEVTFVDDRQGWLLAPATPGTTCQPGAPAVWHTADAGTTWLPLVPSGIDSQRCANALAFTDAGHGFLAGSNPSQAPVIYRSADGGRTWTASAPLPTPPGVAEPPDASPVLPGIVQAYGPTLLLHATVQVHDYVYRSTDGGATWSFLAAAPAGLQPISFVTATHWLIVGPGVQETVDGGATWHAFTSDYGQAAPIPPAVVFGDPQVGYATARGAIQRTLDGGHHWTMLQTPGTAG